MSSGSRRGRLIKQGGRSMTVELYSLVFPTIGEMYTTQTTRLLE